MHVDRRTGLDRGPWLEEGCGVTGNNGVSRVEKNNACHEWRFSSGLSTEVDRGVVSTLMGTQKDTIQLEPL